MYVSIVQTDAEGQARGLMEVMSNADAVAIAGGDGTLSEVS
jgi:diacylglycerol kinase family enzyme